MRCRLFLALVCALSTSGALALDDELTRCAARALPADTMVQRQQVTTEAAAGWSRASTRYVQWKRVTRSESRLLLEVEAPRTEAGLKVLIIKRGEQAPEVWVYTPDTGRARRMVGAGGSNSILGSDITAADADQLARLLQPGVAHRLPDVEIEGRAAYALKAEAEPRDQAYAVIEVAVDQQWCIPLRVEFRAEDGASIKILSADVASVRPFGERWLATRLVFEQLQAGTRTTVHLSDIRIDPPLEDHLFSTQAIEQGR